MAEAQLRDDLMYIIKLYNEQKNLSLGTEYYIFKDVFNELQKAYNFYLQEELKKQQEEKEEKE